MLPCVIFEDEHLLVINKPAGMNTHAPGPYAGEGIYDWLRNREPRRASLAIIHRLDKETSGVMVFGKTKEANRSLTEQFTNRTVRKKYLLLTDREAPKDRFVVKSSLIRAGEKYLSRPVHAGAEIAETRFSTHVGDDVRSLQLFRTKNETPYVVSYKMVEAQPFTGRTHQIRVHAASSGFPILGDTLYGGSSFSRVCLHAAELTVKHPTTGKEMSFSAKADFEADARVALRRAIIEAEMTNAFRLIHGASDGWPGWFVDKLDDFLLAQSEHAPTAEEAKKLERLMKGFNASGAYHKTLTRQVRKVAAAAASPQLVSGRKVSGAFTVQENGAHYELSFDEGYSVGLFLDQRDNRRRFLTGYIAPGFSFDLKGAEVLNTFAYTCGFSVCAAMSGARVTSLDLSKKYLEWGRRNFALNELDAAAHDFIYGDAFDWMNRLAKKGRSYDVVILDPPTFSQSKERGIFRAEKDYGELVQVALPLIKNDGILFASTNAAGWPAEEFLAELEKNIRSSRRKILQRHYSPQPPDFPISKSEAAYLKTVWLRID